MRVFLDTSALFAVLVRNDCMHARARGTFEKLVGQGAELATTSYVVLEVVALLQARVGLDAARLFHHEFLPLVRVAWVDETLHERAFRRLEMRGRRDLSLVDCLSFVWMEDEGLTQVFAYDRHFADEGFTTLETANDVAGQA